MPANLENSAVATGLEKVSFHSNPKERQYQRMLKLLALISHASDGEVNGNPLQYSCLENPTNGGPWWAAVYGVDRVRHDGATSLSHARKVMLKILQARLQQYVN